MEDKELLQEEESSIITFVDENGEEVAFEYMDCIEYQGKEYLALLPVEEEGSVVILEVEPVDEENEKKAANTAIRTRKTEDLRTLDFIIHSSIIFVC